LTVYPLSSLKSDSVSALQAATSQMLEKWNIIRHKKLVQISAPSDVALTFRHSSSLWRFHNRWI